MRCSGWSSVVLCLTLSGVTAFPANPGFAQETFWIDYERARTIIEGPWRAIDPYEYAIDHPRRVLYVHDLEEPDGIMAFSLESGEWLRTIRIPLGEGPGELKGFGGVALAPGGGLYLWRYPRTILVNAMGAVVGEWRPDAASLWMDMCVFGAEPAVPSLGGLVRRGAEGRDERMAAPSMDRGVLQGDGGGGRCRPSSLVRHAHQLHGRCGVRCAESPWGSGCDPGVHPKRNPPTGSRLRRRSSRILSPARTVEWTCCPTTDGAIWC